MSCAPGTGLLTTLQGAGLDAGKAGPFVSMFFSFARQKAGADLVGRVVSQVPALAGLIK